MMDLLPKLRADFELVAAHCLESGEWTQEDKAEFNAAIRAAKERNDEACLILWARDMALRANAVLYHNLVVRGVEATMRARIAAERAGQ